MSNRSPYDSSKDKLIKSYGNIGGGYLAELRQYEDGEEKLVVLKGYGRNRSVRQIFRLELDEVRLMVNGLVELFSNN